MSLESAYATFRRYEKETSFKKLLAYSLILGVISVGIAILINPHYLEYYPNATAQAIILSILTMAFMTMYLVFAGGVLAGGIMVTWVLIKFRDGFYHTNSIINGRSLSTNHEFLHRLAYGLFPYLFWFIRGYNDPRFEEMETKHERHHNERMENERLYLNQNSRLANEVKKIPILEAKIEELQNSKKQWQQIASDVSFKADYKGKQLDKFQTRITDFVNEH
jgi:hypothetical protein